eukprot:9305800-Alexandrium_andersonii.AAC.1
MDAASRLAASGPAPAQEVIAKVPPFCRSTGQGSLAGRAVGCGAGRSAASAAFRQRAASAERRRAVGSVAAAC